MAPSGDDPGRSRRPQAEMPSKAAELAYHFIDCSYRSTDQRELDEHGGLPGVTREYRQPVTVSKWGAVEKDGYTYRLYCIRRETEEDREAIELGNKEVEKEYECVLEGVWGEKHTLLLPDLTREKMD